MSDRARPTCIVHWEEIEDPRPLAYDRSDEPMGLRAAFGPRFGLTRIAVNHERLLPGRRSSYPHAESAEEEFVYVLSGTPDVWLDGELHRLRPGDAVGFPAGTGQAHSFLNNTEEEVHILIVGEPSGDRNRVHYPRNPEEEHGREDWWPDPPERPLGSHDGLTDARRKELAGRR